MGFIICSVEPIAAGCVSVRRLRSFRLAGPDGALARILTKMPLKDDVDWSLSAAEVLQRADPEAHGSSAIFFDLTPFEANRIDLYALVKLTGRTDPYTTDFLAHFKVACQRRGTESFSNGEEALMLSRWSGGTDSYEHLKLLGGTAGGDWTWSESKDPLSEATVRGSISPSGSLSSH